MKAVVALTLKTTPRADSVISNVILSSLLFTLFPSALGKSISLDLSDEERLEKLIEAAMQVIWARVWIFS